MTILEPGSREHGELDVRSKANMERCANFLVRMIEKYGKQVLILLLLNCKTSYWLQKPQYIENHMILLRKG